MEPGHINPAFDADIARMDELLEQMEEAVAGQIALTKQAFSQMDVEGAKVVHRNDATLNSLSKQVEAQVVSVLTKYQPVAEDLRHAIGALKMSIEYERAGDYVKHLAKNVARMAAYNETLEVLPLLMSLLDEVEKMFGRYQQARRQDDLKLAIRVWIQDQKIDDLCSEVVRETFANHKRGDGNIYSLIHAVSVAKNLERVGDKIKNLVEIFYQHKTGDELDIKVD